MQIFVPINICSFVISSSLSLVIDGDSRGIPQPVKLMSSMAISPSTVKLRYASMITYNRQNHQVLIFDSVRVTSNGYTMYNSLLGGVLAQQICRFFYYFFLKHGSHCLLFSPCFFKRKNLRMAVLTPCIMSVNSALNILTVEWRGGGG